MRRPLFLIATLLITSTLSSRAQDEKEHTESERKYIKKNEVSKIESLKIGEKVPEILFHTIVNYNATKGKLSDFKGKFVILDIWNKYCTFCISSFPKMEELQNKFSDKLQVLLVTNNSLHDYSKLKERSLIVQSTKLPFILNDTIVKKLFQYKSVPTHIWIDDKGTLCAITNWANATPANLKEWLNGGKLKFNISSEGPSDFDANKSLLSEGQIQISKMMQYSFFTKSLSNYPGVVFRNINDSLSGKLIGIKYLNVDLLGFYGAAYPKYAGKTIFEFDGCTDYLIPKDLNRMDNFKKNYSFCYELKLPEHLTGSFDAIRNKLQEDLELFFDLKATVEKREMQSLSLIKINTKSKRIATEKDKSEALFEKNSTTYFLRNLSTTEFAGSIERILSEENSVLKVHNDAEYTGTISMDLLISKANLTLINSKLSKFGLKVIPFREEIEVLVLKKIKK